MSNFGRSLNNFSPLMDHLTTRAETFVLTFQQVFSCLCRSEIYLPVKHLEGSQTKLQDLGFSWTNKKCTTEEADYHSNSLNLPWT